MSKRFLKKCHPNEYPDDKRYKQYRRKWRQELNFKKRNLEHEIMLSVNPHKISPWVWYARGNPTRCKSHCYCSLIYGYKKCLLS